MSEEKLASIIAQLRAKATIEVRQSWEAGAQGDKPTAAWLDGKAEARREIADELADALHGFTS